MNKVYSDAGSALDGILKDGMTIMAGGFGLCGIPEHLILALRDSGIKDLTVISNNAGIDDAGLGLLLETRQISKMVSSYVGENKTFEKQDINNEENLNNIINDLKQSYENNWKKNNLINTSIKLPITISIDSKKYNLMKKFEKKIENLDLVSNFYIENFSNKETIYKNSETIYKTLIYIYKKLVFYIKN